MPTGKIRFGDWLLRLITWDSLLPIVVFSIPALIHTLFPNNRGIIEITAVVLPIAACFIRMRAGRRHIAANNCSLRFRRFQTIALIFGLVWLAVIDAVIVLSRIVPQGAIAFRLIDYAIFAALYLPPMTFAMYPGRAWSDESEADRFSSKEIIQQTRSAIGPAPRKFSWWTRVKLWTPRQVWVRPDGGLFAVYCFRRRFLEEGEIVWAALVQANNMLFKPGRGDFPALVVYAVDQSLDNTPEWLLALAHWMFRLKNTTPEGLDEQAVAAMVSDEFNHDAGAPLPPTCTHGREIVCSTIMIFRNHLPGGVLRGGCFPIFIHRKTTAAMIVPCQFWPESFFRRWKEGFI
jgi:hypothetical protein